MSQSSHTEEVEVRVFLTDAEYSRLEAFFSENAELLYEDEQKTLYLKGKEDLRLQQGLHGARLVLKDGRVHDPARQRVEVPFPRESFQAAIRIMELVGRPIDVAWFRKRKTYRWNDLYVTLDDTRDYEKVLEFSQDATPEEAESVREQMRQKLAELDLTETPLERANRAYESYIERNRVPEGGEVIQAGRECVCGKSSTMPICDGTHSDIESGDGPKVSFDDWFEEGHDDDLLKNV